MHHTLVVILGPTGVGKSDFSVDLARMFSAEIISCDSRQFYREMSIGTCVPTDEQLRSVKHHFIRFLSVEDYYSASRFELDVINILPKLFSVNDIVIMTGGSALYADAVCNGIDDIPDSDPAAREKYSRLYREEGLESLRVALKIMDPGHYHKVDLRNPNRIIRALEICETTGRPYSTFLSGIKTSRDFRIIKIGLTRPRKELYDRINLRVEKMIESGLVNEARNLYEKRHLNALNTVGYKEIFGYIEHKHTLDKAVELIKRNTRRYAKRQLTWWGRDESIKWFHPDESENVTCYLKSQMTGASH